MAKKRVLILGGGFGGIYVAVHLGKLLTPRELEEIEVVLVNKENYITFQPLLPEVISGSVELNHVIAPIRRMAPKALLYTRDVETIDPIRRVVTLSPGARPEALTLTYDHLVIAMGTRLDHSKIPGMREHASPFKYLGDALYLRHQLIRALEEAETETDPEMRRQLLTFVVAGGGFSGVECIAEMNDFLREAVRAYHHIAESDLRLILLQRGERILPELTQSLAAFAHKLLVKRGVEIRLGAGLKAVSATAVVVEDMETGKIETVGTRTTVATVPSGSHPLLAALPLPKDKGRIVVTQETAVPEWPGLWALGDCAAIKQVDGQMSPPTAQHALRQAKTCAENIVASFRGTPTKIFKFTGLGKLGSLGRRSAVAEIFGIHLKGIVAWLLWRGVYVTKFPGLDGQLRLLVDWALDVFLPRDITQLRLFHAQPVHREHFEPGETVFKSGDLGDKVYFIVKGEAVVEREGETLATLQAGEVFGEAALISNQPRNAAIRASTALDAVAVSREAFHELLGHLPGVSGTMQEIMSLRMDRRVDLDGEMQRVERMPLAAIGNDAGVVPVSVRDSEQPTLSARAPTPHEKFLTSSVRTSTPARQTTMKPTKLISLTRAGSQLLVTGANRLQSPFLLAVRLYWGWMFFQTGKGKLINHEQVTEFFTSLNIPMPGLNAYMAGATECFGGLLLLAGLASRLTAIPLIATMLVAYLTADLEAVQNIFSEPDKFTSAAPFLFLLASLIVFAFGPGAFSLDRLIAWKFGSEPKPIHPPDSRADETPTPFVSQEARVVAS
jgi:NADH:ubiquinone reductase (H+-translocating)